MAMLFFESARRNTAPPRPPPPAPAPPHTPTHAPPLQVLFGLFTLAMFTEQISSILSDQTGIERLKNDYVAPQRSALSNMSETFGRPFSLLWLVRAAPAPSRPTLLPTLAGVRHARATEL